ncbi:MAG TPA: hypothetical protein ENG78_01080 [Acidiferrobacteraceae bacterium]|nr:hypothetical protein [Acidiferrobacteraceae bacterium]HEX19411.1 hypothetical protein [Acidiferrobacteraceae bacterium]
MLHHRSGSTAGLISETFLAKHLPALLLGITLIGLAPVIQAADILIFSAPPRGPALQEAEVYAPIAQYLSEVTGKTIIYRHPGNWLSYQRNMQRGVYDLVFDGPHFVSWRMARAKHQPLVSMPGKLSFVVYTRVDNTRIRDIYDLRGRTICGLAPPNLATLTMYDQFRNPARQPLVREVKNSPAGYKAVLAGKCVAGVMRDKLFNKLNKKGYKAKIIFHSKGVANQAFSAGPRISKTDKEKITRAIMSPQGVRRMANFHKRFNKKNKPLSRARRKAYDGLWRLLKDVWGFEIAVKKASRPGR